MYVLDHRGRHPAEDTGVVRMQVFRRIAVCLEDVVVDQRLPGAAFSGRHVAKRLHRMHECGKRQRGRGTRTGDDVGIGNRVNTSRGSAAIRPDTNAQ